jgi:hypothetical protein
MIIRTYKALRACCKFEESPCSCIQEACGIPCRIFHDWVFREGSPLKKLGRNADLPVDAEKQLHEKIVRLQEVGFGLTLNQIRRFPV